MKLYPKSKTLSQLFMYFCQIVKDYIKKIWIFIALFKLLLAHVKMELMLFYGIFWWFLGCASTRPLIETLVFQ